MVNMKNWMRKIYNEFGEKKQLELFEYYLDDRVNAGIDTKLNRKKELKIYNKINPEKMQEIIDYIENKYHLCYRL